MYKMIIDTETANGLEQPLPYDIGYQIFDDKNGRVVCSRSFVVAEIFLDDDLMSGAFYAKKMPRYWDDIKAGKRSLKKIVNIRKILHADIAKWNITEIGAYNMAFDKKAVANDTRYITSSFLRYLFPYGMKYFCIWNMACSSILQTPEYINFILENNLLTDKGNIPTSAETVYKYLQNDIFFEESHTGLEDVRIEKDIYFAIVRSDMEYNNEVSSNCWMQVAKYYKKYKEENGQ